MEIKTLEQYVQLLGVHCAALVTLAEIQKHACKGGVLNEDEIETARTIVHQINRLLTVMNDQCWAVGKRFPGGWPAIKDKIRTDLQEKPKNE